MDTRERLRDRRRIHQKALKDEMGRLTKAAIEIGVKRIVLFGSAVKGHTGLTSDLDFLVVWDTPLDYMERTTELYRLLKPRVPCDILAYTPKEMEWMIHNSLVKQALKEGRVLYEA